MSKEGFKLSTREKWLIGLLAFFLAAVFFVLVLFLPARQTHADVTALLDEAKMLEMQTQSQLASIPSLETAVTEKQRDLDRTTAKLEPYTMMEDLVANFTDFMLTNGIRPDGVTLSFDEKENEEQVTHGLIRFTVKMKGTGAFDDLLKLVDYADEVYSYRLISMSTSQSAEGPSASYEVEAMLKVEDLER